MQIRQFEASSIQAAMAEVRRDMGPEAVILSTRQEVINGKPRVIVTAAVDREISAPSCQRPFGGPKGEDLQGISGLFFEDGAFYGIRDDQARTTLLMLKQMIEDVLQDRFKGSQKKNSWERWIRVLTDRGIERAVALLLIKKLTSKMKDESFSKLSYKHVHGVLARMFRVTGDVFGKRESLPRFVVFLGPPGVGKTTTLAKMAARLRRTIQRPVVLLSTDVYRIGAMDQLYIYGNLMDLPVESVYSKKDFHRICASYPGDAVFMVDTTGRSHLDDQGLMEIKILLDPMVKKMRAFLLLDAGKKREDLLDEIQGFSLFPFQSLIWTKVDETRMPGEMINIFLRTRIPVSYITTGQNVPGDMEVADPARLAEIVLTDEKSRSYLWTKQQNFAYPTNA